MKMQRILKGFGAHIKERYNPNGRAAVLYFHRILNKPDPMNPGEISQSDFDQLLSALSIHFDFSELGLIKTPPESDRPRLAITFDDGYQDNLTLGLPVLKKHNAPATVFVASQGVEKGILWQDMVTESIRIASAAELQSMGFCYQGKTVHRLTIAEDLLKRCKRMPLTKRTAYIEELLQELHQPINELPRLMLTKHELRQLANDPLITIGGHTKDHVILSQESNRQAEAQIRDDKDALVAMSGQPVHFFAYPNGEPGRDFNHTHIEQLKRVGYRMAFSTADGGIDEDSDDFLLPRFLPYRKMPAIRALSALKIAGEQAVLL